MTASSNILSPYQYHIGIIASTISILQYFAGIYVCYQVYSTKRVTGPASKMFIGNVAIAMLGLKFSLLTDDRISFVVYSISMTLQSTYVMVFWYYSQNRKYDIYHPILLTFLLVVLVYGYAALEDPDKLKFRYGLIMTGVIFSVLSVPLQKIVTIIKQKDASEIPISIIVVTGTAAFFWFLYASASEKSFLMVQSGVALLICILQIILWFVYPKRHEE